VYSQIFNQLLSFGWDIKTLVGILFITTGYFDAIKYVWEGRAIKNAKTARGHSRKFINVAIVNDIVRFVYGCLLVDFYIVVSSLTALVCMTYMFLQLYYYYPYKHYPKMQSVQRPNILLYTWNSILPNRIRKRL